MATDETYWPRDGTYVPFPGIFATWLSPHGDAPNPCRKYHVSTDVSCAAALAAVALPILRDMGLYHKIVQSRSRLERMQTGDQAGKFITIYAPPHSAERELVDRLGGALAATPGLRPSPTIPRARQYGHVFMERWLDERMFIYGGFETDPGD
jgi:hypothetical protein